MRLIAILAVLSLLACERSPTAPDSRFLVTAYVTPDTVKAGEATSVIVAITNVSNQPQTYETNFCGPAYHVSNAAGTDVDTTGFCASYSLPKTLAPGAQDVYSSVWTTSAGSPATPLAAGAYTVRGVLSGDGIENYSYGVQVVP